MDLFLVQSHGRVRIWKTAAAGGGPEEKVLPDVNVGLAYRVGMEGIYYSARDADGGRVPLYDFHSRKTSVLFRRPLLDPNGLALSPDRSWLLVVQAVKPDSDLMPVDNFH